ncbi:hypothetical protein LUZ60_011900 [Juncus effusus]|nr:hypothetical protein LUZ60_011900 [Juncus effusus]
MESVLVEQSFNGGALFRSVSLENYFPFKKRQTLPSSNQPPLLPLPSINPAWRGMPRQQTHQKPPRHASTSPRKIDEKHVFVSAAVPVQITGAVRAGPVRADGEEEEVVWTGTGYSVSPPPSSVPIPRFVLAQKGERGKNGEKEEGDVDACATNELRRLLKL